MKFEFVPWTELCRPLPQRAQFQGQALRPDHRRQPVDRRLGRERPLRQAQRFLRQGRDQDERLRRRRPSSAIRNGRRTRRTTGRCRPWATPSAGPIARTGSPSPNCRRSSRRSTAAIWPRPKTFDRAQGDRGVLPEREIDGKKVYGASIYTERGSEGITMGVIGRALLLTASNTRTRTSPTTWKASSIPTKSVKGLEFYKALYKCCTPPGASEQLHGRRPRRLQIRPGGDADELSPSPGPACTRTRRSAATRSASSPTRRDRTASSSPSSAARASRSSPTPTSRTRRCSTSSGSPSRRAEEVVVARRLFLPQGGA